MKAGFVAAGLLLLVFPSLCGFYFLGVPLGILFILYGLLTEDKKP